MIGKYERYQYSMYELRICCDGKVTKEDSMSVASVVLIA